MDTARPLSTDATGCIVDRRSVSGTITLHLIAGISKKSQTESLTQKKLTSWDGPRPRTMTH